MVWILFMLRKVFKCVEMCSFMHKIVHFLFLVCWRKQKMKKLNCIVYSLLVSLINASAGVWNNLQQRLPPKAPKFLTFSDTKTCLFLFELCSCCYWFVERQNLKQTNTIVETSQWLTWERSDYLVWRILIHTKTYKPYLDFSHRFVCFETNEWWLQKYGMINVKQAKERCAQVNGTELELKK
jgi:hypothetical protein